MFSSFLIMFVLVKSVLCFLIFSSTNLFILYSVLCFFPTHSFYASSLFEIDPSEISTSHLFSLSFLHLLPSFITEPKEFKVLISHIYLAFLNIYYGKQNIHGYFLTPLPFLLSIYTISIWLQEAHLGSTWGCHLSEQSDAFSWG